MKNRFLKGRNVDNELKDSIPYTNTRLHVLSQKLPFPQICSANHCRRPYGLGNSNPAPAVHPQDERNSFFYANLILFLILFDTFHSSHHVPPLFHWYANKPDNRQAPTSSLRQSAPRTRDQGGSEAGSGSSCAEIPRRSTEFSSWRIRWGMCCCCRPSL